VSAKSPCLTKAPKKVFLAHRNEFIPCPLAATREGPVVAFEFDVHGVLETYVAA
jgi:hypothetical protein